MTEKKEKKAREVRTDLINQTLTKYIKTERTDSNIKSIFNAWENGYFITIEEWLQRCAQEKAWTMRGHEKSVSYMKGLIIEEKTNTQSMSLVNGKRVADLLEEIIRSGTSEYVGIAKQILKKLKDAASKVGGVENIKICIDGQNRGLYAITNFFESEFPIEINFKENPELSGSFYYDELPQTVQDQIDNVKIQVDLVHTLDIERVLDRVIAMNEGESWNPTERRSIRFKPVSFIINQLAADPIVSWFFSQILDKQKGHGIKGVQGDYFRFKKGDILILSELLYYTINGHFGSARQLDAMYNGKVEDEKIQTFEEIVKFIVNIFHTNKELLKEMKLLSMFKDLFICTKILIDENGRQRGAMFGASKVMSLKEVKDKPSYIKSLLKPMLDLYTDKKDRIAVRKKTGVHYEPKPGTWSFHHKSQTQVDVLAREEFLVTKEPKILKKAYHNMVKNNVVHARYERDDIDKMDRMQLELANEKTDYERWNSFEPAHVKTVDHTTPVSRGGSSDISNLGLMPKELNSSKNAR